MSGPLTASPAPQPLHLDAAAPPDAGHAPGVVPTLGDADASLTHARVVAADLLAPDLDAAAQALDEARGAATRAQQHLEATQRAAAERLRLAHVAWRQALAEAVRRTNDALERHRVARPAIRRGVVFLALAYGLRRLVGFGLVTLASPHTERVPLLAFLCLCTATMGGFLDSTVRWGLDGEALPAVRARVVSHYARWWSLLALPWCPPVTALAAVALLAWDVRRERALLRGLARQRALAAGTRPAEKVRLSADPTVPPGATGPYGPAHPDGTGRLPGRALVAHDVTTGRAREGLAQLGRVGGVPLAPNDRLFVPAAADALGGGPLVAVTARGGMARLTGVTPDTWPDKVLTELAAVLPRYAGPIAAYLNADDEQATTDALAALAAAEDAARHAAARQATVEESMAAWDGVFLPEAVSRRLLTAARRLAHRDPAAPTGTLLLGPPGTGKTEVARRLARTGQCAFLSSSAAELKAPNVGGTEERVRELWAEARRQAPCILFFDEADAVFPDRREPGLDAFAQALTNSALASWQGMASSAGVWVVAATNLPERMDPAIVGRFGITVPIPLPDAVARAGLLGHAAYDLGVPLPEPALERLVEATGGLSGRDLGTIVRELASGALLDPEASADPARIDAAVRAAVRAVRGRSTAQVDPSARWNTLVLPSERLEHLETTAAMLREAERVQAQGLTPPRSLLLVGPPGTGKTQVARTIANEAGLAFFTATPATLKGQHVGHTAARVHALFERARVQAPAIVFLDELDGIAPTRGTADSFADDLTNQLLTELDGVAADPRLVFLLGATNRPDAVDPAIRSRFLETIEIPLPTPDQRARLLRVLLAGKPMAEADRDQIVAALAAGTAGASGRDLRHCVEAAERRAFRRAHAAGQTARITLLPVDFGVA